MMTGRKVVQFTGSFYDLLNPGIAEFDNITGFHINEVIMLHAMICLLKLSNILTKLMFNHKAAVQQ